MIGVGVSALALAVVSYIGVECAVESVRWRCHPDEKSVATRIRDLGGGYRATGHERWHIASVWLNDTQATDADIEAVLTLSQLQFLDLRCTQASNAVLHEICAHDRLRDVRVYGTLIETQAIERLWELWNGRLYIDTESHGGSCKDRRSRNEAEQKGGSFRHFHPAFRTSRR